MRISPFNQPPPQLGNQYDDDRVLRSLLARRFGGSVPAEVLAALREMGELAGGELYRAQLDDRLNEPRLVQWDAWGNRVDAIELSPLWRRAEPLAAEFGLVATGYEPEHGPLARTVQFALVHLFHPSTDVYSCPLAMTDGAARTLLDSGHAALIERAVPHLTSRDPARFWTSGQWMTESTGGSDVGASETVAKRAGEGWQLWGRKWFTSAATSQIALTLARPEGNPPGGRGLALFYVETRDAAGRLDHIEVLRLKDKLGTRKVPTAELVLNGTPAIAVAGERDGIRGIVPMLTLTRTWNSICAAAFMRRGVALAMDYARRREAFGRPLAQQPLHRQTLAAMQAEYEAAFQLCFELVHLLGRAEHGACGEDERALLRLLTALTKLTTGKQVVAVSTEAIECFGGAGYVEDTGLPVIVRDAQVLPIWEGTTNVLSLELLKACGDGAPLGVLRRRLNRCLQDCADDRLAAAGSVAAAAADRALAWYRHAAAAGPEALQAQARGFALTLGRATALALLCEHAQWSLDQEQDGRARAAALAFAATRIDLLDAVEPDDAQLLVE
ncbi:MAG: acyl-CoA dehydrogenase family protein [Gammaproteobacteria bacterium]|jgi:alkylation response protein AidB-like acyl-CoA dehydrogenase